MPKCGQHRSPTRSAGQLGHVLISGQTAAIADCSKSDPTPTKGRVVSGSRMTPEPTVTQRSTFLKPRELRQVKRHHRPAITAVDRLGAALTYDDGAITPSIRSSRHSRVSTWRPPPS